MPNPATDPTTGASAGLPRMHQPRHLSLALALSLAALQYTAAMADPLAADSDDNGGPAARTDGASNPAESVHPGGGTTDESTITAPSSDAEEGTGSGGAEEGSGGSGGDAVGQAGGSGGDAKEEAGGAGGDAKEEAGGAGGDAKEEAGGAGGDAKEGVGGAGGDAVGQVGGAGGDAKEGVGGAGGDAVGQVGGAGGDAAEDATSDGEPSSGVPAAPSGDIGSTSADADPANTEGQAAEPYALRPYTARYQVKVRRLRAGYITASLIHKGKSKWLRESQAHPKGMAVLFTSSILEDSHFTTHDGLGVESLSFYLRDVKIRQSIQAAFSESGRAVSIEAMNADKFPDGVHKHPADPKGTRILDDTNWVVEAALSHLGGRLPQDYLILGNSGIHPNTISHEHDETIAVLGKEYHCALIRRTRTNRKDDYIRLWLAKDYNYAPVRVERRKNGTRLFLLQLSDISFHQDPPAQP